LRGKPHETLDQGHGDGFESGLAARSAGAAPGVLFVLALLVAFASGPVRAADDGSSQPAPPAPAPAVPLDRLLELPQGFELRPPEQRSGQGEAEWRRRFMEARAQAEEARAALERSKAELAELATSSDAWTVAPPVGAPAASNEAPLSYALRQRINREEAAVNDSERRLRDLEVEANLADVPDEWRR